MLEVGTVQWVGQKERTETVRSVPLSPSSDSPSDLGEVLTQGQCPDAEQKETAYENLHYSFLLLVD